MWATTWLTMWSTVRKLPSVSDTEVAGSEAATSASEIADALRRRIAEHAMPPGTRLRERDLAAEFGVTRARIRDALTILEGRALISRIPNKGAMVAGLDLQQLLNLYEVREVLEALAVRLATVNADPESWQDLVDFFDGPMSTFVAEGDFDAFLDGYSTFNDRVADAAANPVLSDMLDSIYDRTQVLIRRIIVLPGRAEVGLKEHRAVLAAMRRGEADLAERLRRENMVSARGYLERYQHFVL